MPEDISYIDRKTGVLEKEKVYGGQYLHLLYGSSFVSRYFFRFLIPLLCRFTFFSRIYGLLQSSLWSRRSIVPFIREFGIDISEFMESPETFKSFNAFFSRKFKATARPIHPEVSRAVVPADCRVLAYPSFQESEGFFIKGNKFSLSSFLKDADLARDYARGSILLCRLCPSDYHRFHFPVSGKIIEKHLINGFLYSVNPIALKNNIQIYSENKRFLTIIDSPDFGKVLYIIIGATNVGSIDLSFQKGDYVNRGDEAGYFSFGGSALVVIFPENSISLDNDLVQTSQQFLETRCLLGGSLGLKIRNL